MHLRQTEAGLGQNELILLDRGKVQSLMYDWFFNTTMKALSTLEFFPHGFIRLLILTFRSFPTVHEIASLTLALLRQLDFSSVCLSIQL